MGPDEVDEDLHDEIQQECGKYGKVQNVVIYQVPFLFLALFPFLSSPSFSLYLLFLMMTKPCQEKQDDTEEAEVDVKIFVEFTESIEAKKAKNALDGR